MPCCITRTPSGARSIGTMDERTSWIDGSSRIARSSATAFTFGYRLRELRADLGLADVVRDELAAAARRRADLTEDVVVVRADDGEADPRRLLAATRRVHRGGEPAGHGGHRGQSGDRAGRRLDRVSPRELVHSRAPVGERSTDCTSAHALPLPDAGGGARPADRRLWSMKKTPSTPPLDAVLGAAAVVAAGRLAGDGPAGKLPFTPEMLREAPSGDLFGLTQNVGMGWSPARAAGSRVRHRQHDGRAARRGRHGGRARLPHRALGDRPARARSGGDAARRRARSPSRRTCSDPCDGRTQGTTGMFDSLAYRNDAAIVMRRLIRSLPTASGVMGIATCDKGLPATMLALAGVVASCRASSCRAA